jgi:RNA polymerase sigma-70 factor (subfamily 1)
MESSALRTEDRLVARARQGSRSALQELFTSVRPWLRRHVRPRLPRELVRKQDVSDLVQETQCAAAAHFAQFEGQSFGEFRAWLAGILDRLLLRSQRFWGEKRRDRKREQPLSPAWAQQDELVDAATSILERLSQEEECERLNLAASWCREEDRAVISLHLFEGRSHDEIATELGVATTTARQRYCRAVRRLREAMQLLELMTRRGYSSLQQDVVGIYRFRGIDPGRIAERLQVPEKLVACWVAEAQPLLRAMAKDSP